MAIRTRESKSKKSGKVYEVYFTYKNSLGITERYSRSGFPTKKEALEHEALMRAEYVKIGDLIRNNRKTFCEVYEEYMQVEGAKYAPSTVLYYTKTYKAYIKKSSIGNKEIYKIRYKELQMYFNDMAIVGIATLKNMKKIFNVTFKYAMKSEYIPSNPMLMVELNAKIDRKEKIMEITEEQFTELCKRVLIIDKNVPDRESQCWNYFNYFIALYVGWYLGLRISETLGLKKDDFDFKNDTVTIQRRLEYQGLLRDEIYLTERMKTKGSKAELPLAEPLKELLILWFKENPYDLVICDINGRLIHPATLNFRIRKIGREMGIDFHYHLLRHSFASRLVRNNINPKVVQKVMRHSQVSTTLEKYTHVNDDDKRKAIDTL